MAKLIFTCPVCNKKADQLSESKFQNIKFIRLSCGHTTTDKLAGFGKKDIEFKLDDDRELYPFQQAGVEFIRDSNFRCLIADEMGLGKTIQVVNAFKNFGDEILPAIVIVKASLKVQWLKELFNGASIVSQILETKTEPINHDKIKVYITTYDSLRNATWKDKINYRTIVLDECQQIKNHSSKRTNMVRDLIARKGNVEKVDKKFNSTDPKVKRITMIAQDLMRYHGIASRFEFKILTNMKKNYLGLTKCKAAGEGIIKGSINLNSTHVMKDNENEIIETILHEIAHAITPGAGHKTIWHETAIQIGGNGDQFAQCPGSVDLDHIETEPAVKYIIATSGTPIKNNAGEYFPILNILRPELFHEQNAFIQQWTDAYRSGYGWKVGGLRNPEKFKEFTKDFIIRRSRKEVLPDLPAIRRSFRYTEMNEEVAKKYKSTLREFDHFMNNEDDYDSNEASTHILAFMNKMRHLAGYAKIADVMSYVEEFNENEPDEKLTIFHHHIDVADILESQLKDMGIKTARIKGDMDATTRYEIQESFRTSDAKVLIAPTLACGEGINLQFCSHAIIMEREWNPANEEQAEGRFSRIGSTADSIEVNYPVAIGSIDELFAEYVEKKRQWVRETLSGTKAAVADTWSQSQVIKDIATKLLQMNGKSWKSSNLGVK